MQKVLDFLKRHYDKIILCVVLLGLAATAVWLPKTISDAKSQIAGTVPPPPPAVKMTNLNVQPLAAVMTQVTNPPSLVLSGEHNVFNPVVWKRSATGEMIKILKTGADALVIKDLTPLYETIGLDHPSGSGYYMFHQLHSGKKNLEYMKVNEKDKAGLFYLRGIKGAPENPTEMQLEIIETGEKVKITKDQPFQRVDGYTTDLRYEPDSLSLNKKRVGDTFNLDNQPYKIVAITNNAVTVQDQITTKQTTVTK